MTFKIVKQYLGNSYQTQLGIDPVKKSDFKFYGLIRVNLGQPKSTRKNLKKIFKILIFHMKKLRKKIHMNIGYTCCI